MNGAEDAMKSWVLFAVTGMLSIALAGCATTPPSTTEGAPPSSVAAPKTRSTSAATRPAARPATRATSNLAPRPHTTSRLLPAARTKPAPKPPVVAAKPAAPTRPSAEFWDGQGKCEGIASFYGGKFIGRRTANGERYTGRKLTAAHRVLPFGTYLKVTRLDNGLSVIVRINDRGPYIDGRVIDLSPAAAKRIHLIKTGVTHVKLEVVAPWMAED
jgi:rare lipoprotein A